MKIVVWDTYVKRDDGAVMHFDILVPDTLNDTPSVFKFGNDYLATKTFKTGPLTANECRKCHIEQATQSMIKAIQQKGYDIIEMENCD